MLVDLDLLGKDAVILGGGRESEFKARKLLDAGAKVTVISEGFTKGLKKLAASKLRLVRVQPIRYESSLKEQKPCVVIVATDDAEIDRKMADLARSLGALVNVVDKPRLSDFNMPAIAKIGEIRIAISTGGMSPAMARLLRKRIERMIRPEDVLQVELQGHVRRIARKAVADPSSRKEMVYRILRDRNIANLLRQNRFKEAKARAEVMFEPKNPLDQSLG